MTWPLMMADIQLTRTVLLMWCFSPQPCYNLSRSRSIPKATHHFSTCDV